MREQPFISVVMCAYNTRPYISEAVQSVLDQTYSNWELIVSDDGSTDGTREWLEETAKNEPRIRLYLQEKNLGYVANKNFALSQARGEYVIQCDSDDRYAPTILERQLAGLRRFPGIKIVGCGFHWMDESGSIYNTQGPSSDVIIERYAGSPYPFWYPPLLVCRSVLAEGGPFTSFFCGIGDDLYWVIRANERYPILCLSEALYYYRQSPTSISRVLDDERKLITSHLLSTLLEQRLGTGTDWLEQGDWDAIDRHEQSLLKNGTFMSEQHRVWAAKMVDVGRTTEAWRLLKRSLQLNPWNPRWFRTAFYALRGSRQAKKRGLQGIDTLSSK